MNSIYFMDYWSFKFCRFCASSAPRLYVSVLCYKLARRGRPNAFGAS